VKTSGGEGQNRGAEGTRVEAPQGPRLRERRELDPQRGPGRAPAANDFGTF
jgi:hypothetical protein